MNDNPHQADQEKSRAFENSQHIHLHADGCHKNIEKKTPHFGCTRSLKFARFGKREQQSAGRGDYDNPEKSGIETQLAKLWCIFGNPGSNSISTEMTDGSNYKGNGNNTGQIG